MLRLTDTEWKIMELLWKNDSLTTMELSRSLGASEGWSRSTVITMLGRMENKGIIRYENDDKTKRYYPVVARSEAELEATRSLLDKCYGGNIGLMISNMLKHEALSREEIEEIRKIIKDGE